MRRADVQLDCRTVAVELPAEDAMSLALVANELVTNAFKHGCAAGATKISVELFDDERGFTLIVADNGAGIPAIPTGQPASLGLKMVNALSRQLKAETSLPSPGMPATFSVSVKR